MQPKQRITIPQPCHEEWNNMTPSENGKFCGSCSKNVVDFTAMLPEEIQHYFQQNKNQNICGKFRNTQLDSLTIQIPSRALHLQTNYQRIFLLALFIAMGTTLFSCADKNGNKQKIDKVEVVEDSIEMKNTSVGLRLPPKSEPNLQQQMPLSDSKIEQVKFTKPTKKKARSERHEISVTMGMVFIEPTTTKDSLNAPTITKITYPTKDTIQKK